MTQRQWVITQQALVALGNNPAKYWNEGEDGPPPTGEEIDNLVQWLADKAAPLPESQDVTSWSNQDHAAAGKRLRFELRACTLPVPAALAPPFASVSFGVSDLDLYNFEGTKFTAESFAAEISRRVEERLTELGNEVIDHLAQFHGIPTLVEEDDEETLLHIEYKCPKCSHGWSDTWTSAVDAECPECGTTDISPVSWKEADDT